MRYYAQYDSNNKLIAIGIGNGDTEISKEEYDTILTTIREKANFVNRLYNNEITTNDVPTEWQEEIQRRVDERIALQETIDEQDISDSEALNIILGGETA